MLRRVEVAVRVRPAHDNDNSSNNSNNNNSNNNNDAHDARRGGDRDAQTRCVSCDAAQRTVSLSDTSGLYAPSSDVRRHRVDVVFDETTRNAAIYAQLIAPKLPPWPPPPPSPADAHTTATFARDTLCFLAYGHTNSGKTHTIIGSDDEAGVLTLCVRDLLARHGVVEVALLEVYLDRVHDLLAHGAPRRVRQRHATYATAAHRCQQQQPQQAQPQPQPHNGSRHGGAHDAAATRGAAAAAVAVVQDLTTCLLTSMEQWMCVARYGLQSRRTAATEHNARSSRSHAIFTLRCASVRVCFVDLAGSERQRLFATPPNRESISINKSLSRLGTVLEALGTRRVSSTTTTNTTTTTPTAYVNFRDTTLTVLLQRYLCGTSRTTFLACVHPHAAYYHETVSTLRYTQRLMCIHTHTPRRLHNNGVAAVAGGDSASTTSAAAARQRGQCAATATARDLASDVDSDDDDYDKLVAQYEKALRNSNNNSNNNNNNKRKPVSVLHMHTSSTAQQQHEQAQAAAGAEAHARLLHELQALRAHTAARDDDVARVTAAQQQRIDELERALAQLQHEQQQQQRQQQQQEQMCACCGHATTSHRVRHRNASAQTRDSDADVTSVSSTATTTSTATDSTLAAYTAHGRADASALRTHEQQRQRRRLSRWLRQRARDDYARLHIAFDEHFDALPPRELQVVGHVSTMARLPPLHTQQQQEQEQEEGKRTQQTETAAAARACACNVATTPSLAWLDLDDWCAALRMLDEGVPPLVRLHDTSCRAIATWRASSSLSHMPSARRRGNEEQQQQQQAAPATTKSCHRRRRGDVRERVFVLIVFAIGDVVDARRHTRRRRRRQPPQRMQTTTMARHTHDDSGGSDDDDDNDAYSSSSSSTSSSSSSSSLQRRCCCRGFVASEALLPMAVVFAVHADACVALKESVLQRLVALHCDEVDALTQKRRVDTHAAALTTTTSMGATAATTAMTANGTRQQTPRHVDAACEHDNHACSCDVAVTTAAVALPAYTTAHDGTHDDDDVDVLDGSDDDDCSDDASSRVQPQRQRDATMPCTNMTASSSTHDDDEDDVVQSSNKENVACTVPRQLPSQQQRPHKLTSRSSSTSSTSSSSSYLSSRRASSTRQADVANATTLPLPVPHDTAAHTATSAAAVAATTTAHVAAVTTIATATVTALSSRQDETHASPHRRDTHRQHRSRHTRPPPLDEADGATRGVTHAPPKRRRSKKAVRLDACANTCKMQ